MLLFSSDESCRTTSLSSSVILNFLRHPRHRPICPFPRQPPHLSTTSHQFPQECPIRLLPPPFLVRFASSSYQEEGQRVFFVWLCSKMHGVTLVFLSAGISCTPVAFGLARLLPAAPFACAVAAFLFLLARVDGDSGSLLMLVCA